MKIQPPKVVKFYRRLYCGGGGGGGGGAGEWRETCRPPNKRLENCATLWNYIFVSFQQTTLKLDKCTDFKEFFPAVLTDFRQPASVKS